MAPVTTAGPGGYPPGWCFHHEAVHGPMDWSDLCQSPDDVEFAGRNARLQAIWDAADRADRDRKRRWWRWPKVALVCWWKHRTRKVGEHEWLTHYCWACTGIGRR
jgi:hypothetical protein